MSDEVLYDLGVDIGSEFTFVDGDLKLASYDTNLVQAVVNRLNTRLNSLDLFYEDYGSVLTSFFGWKANTATIELIRVELDTTLRNEQRIADYSAEIEYDAGGVLHIDLSLTPISGVDVDVNLILNSMGELEVVEMEE